MSAVLPTLLLPRGRTADIAGDAHDRSVFRPLLASGGDWEPHLRLLLERLVEPDWVCVDIGANIGVHTLTMATLAESGRVVAFEASEANFAHLERNAARLDAPSAPISCVHVALWDRRGTLELDEIEEFSGCSHITSAVDDGLSYVRAVIPAEVLDGVTVHVHRRTVSAIRLDDWVRDDRLRRLDLVKLDVEGAEARVLAGARRTLARFRPILVTEYHPGVAAGTIGAPPEAYFRLLDRLFETIRVVEADGGLSEPLTAWEPLQRRLQSGKGWEDLLCEPHPRRRLRWRR